MSTMNEVNIIVGMDQDGEHYYAMFANTRIVKGGCKNGIEAVKFLLEDDSSGIGHLISDVMPQEPKPEGEIPLSPPNRRVIGFPDPQPTEDCLTKSMADERINYNNIATFTHCDECGGRGEIVDQLEYNTIPRRTVWLKCKKCNGTGHMIVEM